MSEERSPNQNTFLFFVGLAIVAAFIIGNLWAKVQNLSGGTKTQSTAKTAQGVTPAAQPAGQEPVFDAPDKDKPNLKFFVMSFCPFGNQAEDGLKPVYDLLKTRVEWEPRYVIYGKDYCQLLTDRKAYGNIDDCAKDNCLKKDDNTWYCTMHGQGEINQNVREICAWNMLKDKGEWWRWVDLVNKNCTAENVDNCWEKYAQEAKLNVNAIKTCQEKQAAALLQKEVEMDEKFEAQGSPMVFVNDQAYNGGRTPEAYKKAICSGFKNPPKECDTQLSNEGAAAVGGCE